MEDAMVTGRMPADKKEDGNSVLERAGLNASQAINLLYSRLIEEQSADFLTGPHSTRESWMEAVRFVDSLAANPVGSKYAGMSHAQIKLERAKAKGVV